MLDVEGIHTYYGESHVLHGVSLRVAAGEAVALLGRNGAGKTTLIRSIMGFTPPRDGRILVEGEPIQGWPAHRIARRGLALVPQGRRIFAPLTVRENLLLGARPGDQSGQPDRWTLERVLDALPAPRERMGQTGGTLSGGEQQMLAVGRALLTNGRMLLLDEPSEGLAPLIVREIGAHPRPPQGRAPVDPPRRAELPPRAGDRRPDLRPEQGPGRVRGNPGGPRRQRGRQAPLPRRRLTLRQHAVAAIAEVVIERERTGQPEPVHQGEAGAIGELRAGTTRAPPRRAGEAPRRRGASGLSGHRGLDRPRKFR